MPITQAITPLPPAPNFATDTPEVFSAKAVAHVAAQSARDPQIAAWTSQANALAAEVNAKAATVSAVSGGIPFIFDTATGDVDPTDGKLRLNNATQNAATVIRVDLIGSDANNYTGMLDTFGTSTSPVKGTLTLRKTSDPSKFLSFSVTAKSSPSGYRNYTAYCIGSSSASPFAAGDPLAISFVANGDQGTQGPQGVSYSILRVREEYASGTAGTSVASNTETTLTRVLNTVKTNAISGASLSSNRVTLPDGQYEVDATAPLQGSGASARAFLYCVTDSAIVLLGGVAYGAEMHAVKGELSVSGGPKVYELRHYIRTQGNTATPNFPISQPGQPEVHAEISFKKLS